MKDCSVEGCNNHFYAKGYCHKHYQNNWKVGHHAGKNNKNCEFPNCKVMIKPNQKFCSTCRGKAELRIKYKLPLNFKDCRFNQGSANPRWNGRTPEYRNHYLMKKNRLIKIKEENGKCEGCGKDGAHVHHIDNSTSNHNIDNLLLLCVKCHKLVHPSKTSKYFLLYGATCQEIAEKLNVSTSKVSRLHTIGKLSLII